jgi:predicted ATP-grasp superfamily ATP-dependent carboligase
MLSGQVVGACFLAKQGRVVAVFSERYLRCKDGRFGTSVFRAPLRWPRLGEHVAAMVAQLSWTGIGHFDFIKDASRDEAFLLEMNPRLWGAVNLAYVNGFDFPSALVAQTRGDEDVGRFFSANADVGLRSIWIVGEMIGAVNRWRGGERFGPLRAVWDVTRSLRRSRFDDFLWNDPLPFLAEATCYARLFIRSGGDTNPAGEGMFQ